MSGTHRWADKAAHRGKSNCLSLFSPKQKKQTDKTQNQQAKPQNPENKEQQSKEKHLIQADQPNWQQKEGRPGTHQSGATMTHR